MPTKMAALQASKTGQAARKVSHRAADGVSTAQVPAEAREPDEVAMVDLNILTIDKKYQRTISRSRTQAIAKNFDPVAAGALTVNMREDGTLVVLDGQQRLHAMRLMNLPQAFCNVYYGLSYEEEAQVFVYCNTLRKQPNAVETFRGKVEAKDRLALRVKAILDKHGIVPVTPNTPHMKPNETRSITSYEEIMRRSGEQILDDTISINQTIWPSDGRALGRDLIGGMGFFLGYYGNAKGFRYAQLIDKLKKRTTTDVLTQAYMLSQAKKMSIKRSVAEVILGQFNSGRREKNRLDPRSPRSQVAVSRNRKYFEARKAEENREAKIAPPDQAGV